MACEKRYLMFSIVLAVVALGVLAAGIAAQSDIDWSQSSMVPSATCVKTSDLVTFTVQVVNSSTVTAEDIIISNRIPDGTEFVSVTEGMLITTVYRPAPSTQAAVTGVTGADIEPALDPELFPPGGFSLDYTVGELGDLDPEDVTHVAWIGDLEPGVENMVAFDLVLEVKAEGGDTVTNTVVVLDTTGPTNRIIHQETASVEITDTITVIYIPLVMNPEIPPPPEPDFATTVDDGVWAIGAEGPTFDQAQQGWRIFEPGYHTSLSIGINTYAPIGLVAIVRRYFSFDLSAAPAKRVAEAQLVIEPGECAEVPLFYRADWDDKPGWWSYTDFLGMADPSDMSYQTSHCEAGTITVPLPGLTGEFLPSRLWMLIREREELEERFMWGFYASQDNIELQLFFED